MRTSLNEINAIEAWHFQQGELPDRLLTEAQILSNPQLKEKAKWQSATYDLVKQYGRDKLLHEIRKVEKQLFTVPKYRSFQDRIRSIFKR